MKTRFKEFVNEFIMNKDLYNDYISNLSIYKQIENLHRGNKIRINSDSDDVWVNKPLTFVKFEKSKNLLFAYDNEENVYGIDVSKPNDYHIELL